MTQASFMRKKMKRYFEKVCLGYEFSRGNSERIGISAGKEEHIRMRMGVGKKINACTWRTWGPTFGQDFDDKDRRSE